MFKISAILTLTLLFPFFQSGELQTPYEKSNFTETATYEETIEFYRQLASASPKVKLIEAGMSDIGKPIHLVVISQSGEFDPGKLLRQDKRIVLVNNGIHPGEPCGVDASMMLARDMATGVEFKPLLEHIVVVFIPIYNVGGALNRGSFSRANQVGPVSYGFRGNARNLDLNRDFIKMDSKNARAFTNIFHTWKPDVFIDTHTTNGADYPYVMTLIPTQRDKIHKELSEYMHRMMIPELYKRMADAEMLMSPYVNSIKTVPDSGLGAFMDHPRYSTGYAAQFNCIGFTTEAHMLKSFHERVEATYMFLLSAIKVVNKDRIQIKRAIANANKAIKEQENFTISWRHNMDKHDVINFSGFEAKYKKSEVTGRDRLYYDPTSKWTREIPLYDYYTGEVTVKKPSAYIIPQAWHEVIERMKLNGVEMKVFTEEIKLPAQVYYISDYKTSESPYEGHYPHREVKIRKENVEVVAYKGDVIIYPNQNSNQYILNTLEPQASDSWFNWNFFDEILMQKEYFSPYLFEDTAAAILASNPEIKRQLEAKIAEDLVFANNNWSQLMFVYRKSKFYEKSHLRYPVLRYLGDEKLPVK